MKTLGGAGAPESGRCAAGGRDFLGNFLVLDSRAARPATRRLHLVGKVIEPSRRSKRGDERRSAAERSVAGGEGLVLGQLGGLLLAVLLGDLGERFLEGRKLGGELFDVRGSVELVAGAA